MATQLYVGSSVVAQFTLDGVKHRYPGLVSGHVKGDPDKLRVNLVGTPNDAENLLTDPVTKNRVMQHGDKGEHATFRYVGEDT